MIRKYLSPYSGHVHIVFELPSCLWADRIYTEHCHRGEEISLMESSVTFLQKCIVFILTTSNLPSDKSSAYAAGVAGYVLKSNVASFLKLLDSYCGLIGFPRNASMVMA